jgi:hypothetical protein
VKRHWKLWAGLALVLLFLGVSGVYVATREPEPVRAYNRIKLGMTLQEVEDAIGMPAGNYRTMYPSTFVQVPTPPGCVEECWAWDGYSVTVFLDTDGHVADHFLWIDRPRQPPGIFEKVRKFIGL